MLCPCEGPPRLYMVAQSEQPLLEEVLPQLKALFQTWYPDRSKESFGMDERLELNLSDDAGIFTVKAFLSLEQTNSTLPRNKYVSDMMSNIWSMHGADKCSFYGNVVWLVSYLDEDIEMGDIEVVFNFDEPYVHSFKDLESEWKLWFASGQANGKKGSWSLRGVERYVQTTGARVGLR